MTWWNWFLYTSSDDVSTWMILLASIILAITYGFILRRRQI